MSFDFRGSLEKGKEAAEQVLVYRDEVRSVMHAIESNLKEFLGLEINFDYADEFEKSDEETLIDNTARAIIAGLDYNQRFKNRKKTGYKLVRIKLDGNLSVPLFSMQQCVNGYPVYIKSNNRSFTCMTQEELISTFNIVLEDPSIHLKINQFRNVLNSQ
ncbi:hypothetical protein [Vibrio sp. Sgm 5]|uniref:hypothetical protein n=1 Tax=Vibrio sp. Sgm 5 TaxID=2994387 RepID=UPI002249959F|nr:hypothetical protein [Vibrio sp. Sgm 5]MCX2789411.1 hypothetical protein [Vibrio sp. Sgm 5]